jgi:hypothetical protein
MEHLWAGIIVASTACGGGGAGLSSADASPPDGSGQPSPEGRLPADAAADGARDEARDSSRGSEQGTSDDAAGSPCHADRDCPQPSGQYCVPCFEGGVDCALSQCVAGACVGHAASCPGPITDPCAYKVCGDPCQQCSTPDGGCYAGTCNWFNECKQAPSPACSIDAPYSCAPSDAVGVGDCNTFLGWGWDGSKCIAIVGCECQGSDCQGLTDSAEMDCLDIYSICPRDGG